MLISFLQGYFLLSEGAKIRHGVRTVNITISARNPCFGNRFLSRILNPSCLQAFKCQMLQLILAPSHMLKTLI